MEQFWIALRCLRIECAEHSGWVEALFVKSTTLKHFVTFHLSCKLDLFPFDLLERTHVKTVDLMYIKYYQDQFLSQTLFKFQDLE